jgi:hypothetical protein
VKADPTFWILARALGVTAYALLTASVLAGLVLKTRPFRGLRPAAVTDTHRFLSTLALATTALHGLALTLDRTVPFSLPELLVPGLAEYRPLWTGLGIAAAELAAVVAASFAVRKRMGTKNWRRLHYASYAVFAAATAHGVAAGSDTGRPWATGLYVGAVAAVAAATAFRALAGPPTPARSPGASLAMPARGRAGLRRRGPAHATGPGPVPTQDTRVRA